MRLEEVRRENASAPLAFGVVGAGALGVAAVLWRLEDFGPVPPELRYAAAGLGALVLSLLGAGLWPRLRPLHHVTVDTASGTATFVRDGTVVRQVPVAAVGPLCDAVDQRRVRSGKTYRTATFHVARSVPFPELVLFESENELKTRRVLESCAKAWGVPYEKASGETRGPEELDVPLFQRLGGNETVTATLPQRPNSMLAVEWRDGGHEIRTSYRPVPDRVRIVLALAGPPVLLLIFAREIFLDAVRPGNSLPVRLAAASVFLLSFVPGLVVAGKAWLRNHRPPFIRVSPEGVRYRWRFMPLRSIEEIEKVPDGVCRLVSDRRFLLIDADFCEESEHEWLHHELRRLVVEAGQSSPSA